MIPPVIRWMKFERAANVLESTFLYRFLPDYAAAAENELEDLRLRSTRLANEAEVGLRQCVKAERERSLRGMIGEHGGIRGVILFLLVRALSDVIEGADSLNREIDRLAATDQRASMRLRKEGMWPLDRRQKRADVYLLLYRIICMYETPLGIRPESAFRSRGGSDIP